jgi:hypothetical protein
LPWLKRFLLKRVDRGVADLNANPGRVEDG